MATKFVQVENDLEIQQRLEAERIRLRKIAGLDQPTHFHRPVERAFTAEERSKVTILFGGFTWKHEDLIRAVFQGCGYRCEKLPVPDVPAFQIGKEYGNNGQCNPTYFTVGNLVQYLQFLEKEGLSRKDIIDNYVFFTAGSCGPCRFGMYEAEYRFALKNAGLDGFRVLLFKDSDGMKAASLEPGLKFTIDFGFGMLNALYLGDVFNDLIYQIRPFEVKQGETERVFREAVDVLSEDLRNRDSFEIEQRAPPRRVRRSTTPNKASLQTRCSLQSALWVEKRRRGREISRMRAWLRRCSIWQSVCWGRSKFWLTMRRTGRQTRLCQQLRSWTTSSSSCGQIGQEVSPPPSSTGCSP